MRSLFHSLAPAILGFTTLAAQGSEFAPLFSVTGNTWPGKNHIGVVCNYRVSSDQIADMARAASPGTVITVADTYSASHLQSAQTILRNQKIDYLVLLPRDPNFFEGGINATVLVNRLATNGIPTVGTRPVGLKQGAVFCIGADTHGELLVTDKLVGTVSVILPNRMAKADLPTPLFSTASSYPNGVTVNVLQQIETR